MAPEKDRSDRIRACFRQWDKDAKGYITKADLLTVLTRLLPVGESLSKGDLDRLMEEADRNGNGRIEYHEFVEWLTRPGASLHANGGELKFFDLEELMKPLFEIYDRNGDGSISRTEFCECHNILQTALTLHPAEGLSDPDMLTEAAKSVFHRVDADGNKRLSFEEFVQFQRNALERSGLLNDDLKDLVPALTRQLQRVFKLSESNEQGELLEGDQQVLLHITKNVANFSRDLYNDERANHSSLRGRFHHTNRWSQPPVGLNLERLKGMHLSNSAMPIWGVEDLDLNVLCVPEVAIPENGRRRWLGRVVRKVTYRTGRVETDVPHFYVFADLNWTANDKLKSEFEGALTALPPELRIFCYLKAEANFGVQLTWAQVQEALDECVKAGLLTEEQKRTYCKHVEDEVRETLGSHGAATRPDDFKKMMTKTVQAPREVMATLAELRILKVSSVWADVLKA